MHFRLGGRSRSRDPPTGERGMPSDGGGGGGALNVANHNFGDDDFDKFSSRGDLPHHLPAPSPPALSPMSDPSSDEYESSPEKLAAGGNKKPAYREFGAGQKQGAEVAKIRTTSNIADPDRDAAINRSYRPSSSSSVGRHGLGLHHHNGADRSRVSPWSKVGGGLLFHRSRSPTARIPPKNRNGKKYDEASPIRGVARGAAMAHADNSSGLKSSHAASPPAGAADPAPEENNGFLHILLGEHFASMERLNENTPPPSAFRRHPVYSSPSKMRGKGGDDDNKGEEEGGDSKPMSSLQRRLAEMKKDGSGGSNIRSSPFPSSPSAKHPKHGYPGDGPPSPNHRYRTRWEHQDRADDKQPNDEFNLNNKVADSIDDISEESEDDGTNISPFYEACDEIVNRLGIGKPRYVPNSPARSATSKVSGNPDTTTALTAYESPVKSAKSLYASTTPPTAIATESPIKAVRPLLSGSSEEKIEVVDTAVRRLRFDLPEDLNEEAAADDAGSKAGHIVETNKDNREDDGTVSLLTASSALSSLRKAVEANKNKATTATSPAKSSLRRSAEASAAPAKKSSLQRAVEAKVQQQQPPQEQPSTPNRSNVTPSLARSRSLGTGGMAFGEACIDTSAAMDRFQQQAATTPERPVSSPARKKAVDIATVSAVNRSSLSIAARGGAGIVPVPVIPSESPEKHASHHRQGRKTSSKSNTVYLLLLDPEQKVFELCSIRYDPNVSTVGTILDMIQFYATEPGLAALNYKGLVRPGDGKEFSRIKNDYKCAPIRDGEVIVAVPEGSKHSTCRKIAVPILRDPKLQKLLSRAKKKGEKKKSTSRGKGRSRSKSRNRVKPVGAGDMSEEDGVRRGKPSHKGAKHEQRQKKTRFVDSNARQSNVSSSRVVQVSSPAQPALEPTSASSSPSVDEFRKASVDAASIAASQALEGRIADLERRLMDSHHQGGASARTNLENDLRRHIEERAKTRAEIEEQLRAKVEQKAAEESRPAFERIEELARKATEREKLRQQPTVHSGAGAVQGQLSSTDLGLQSTKRILLDDDTIKTVSLSALAAIAIRASVSSISRVVGFLFNSFAPQERNDYALDIFFPSLEDPNAAPESSEHEAFGFTGVFVLTCFFVMLMKMQQSIQKNSKNIGGTRKSFFGSLFTPSSTKARSNPSNDSKPCRRIGTPSRSTLATSKGPWGERHCITKGDRSRKSQNIHLGST